MQEQEHNMKDFLEEASTTMENLNNTATEIRKASNFLKWLAGIIAVIVLGLYTQTNIEVNKKADKSYVEGKFVSKKDATAIYSLECTNLNDVITQYNEGDSVLILNPFYQKTIKELLTEN